MLNMPLLLPKTKTISAGQKPGFKASPKKKTNKQKENVSSKGLNYRTIGNQPQTLIPVLSCLPWPSHPLTSTQVLPGGALLPLLSVVFKHGCWPEASLGLAPELSFPCSPRWLVGTTKEDPALQPAQSHLPLAPGHEQQEECVHLVSLLPTLSTSNKCNHFVFLCWLEGGVFVSFSSIRTTLFIAAQERRVYVWSGRSKVLNLMSFECWSIWSIFLTRDTWCVGQ